MISDDLELLHVTLTSGAAYIMSRQDVDGSWVDWQLPPGDSRLWTTAFVGCKLRSFTEHLNLDAAPSMHAAGRWLLENRLDDGGWGYNRLVGSDADSTAYAILFLSQSGKPVPETSYARLRAFQQSDGGFSTYMPQESPGSWSVSHPDVTPIALLALLTRHSCDEEFIQGGIDYVLRQRTSAGLWNSFWWESSLYSTEANLSLLNAIGRSVDKAATRESLARITSAKPFDVALQLSALMSSGLTAPETEIHGRVGQYVRRLVHQQQADGSWRSDEILRVTDRDCYDPWAHEQSGALFSDPNRLFTSATVLEALSRVCLRCPSRKVSDNAPPGAAGFDS